MHTGFSNFGWSGIKVRKFGPFIPSPYSGTNDISYININLGIQSIFEEIPQLPQLPEPIEPEEQDPDNLNLYLTSRLNVISSMERINYIRRILPIYTTDVIDETIDVILNIDINTVQVTPISWDIEEYMTDTIVTYLVDQFNEVAEHVLSSEFVINSISSTIPVYTFNEDVYTSVTSSLKLDDNIDINKNIDVSLNLNFDADPLIPINNPEILVTDTDVTLAPDVILPLSSTDTVKLDVTLDVVPVSPTDISKIISLNTDTGIELDTIQDVSDTTVTNLDIDINDQIIIPISSADKLATTTTYYTAVDDKIDTYEYITSRLNYNVIWERTQLIDSNISTILNIISEMEPQVQPPNPNLTISSDDLNTIFNTTAMMNAPDNYVVLDMKFNDNSTYYYMGCRSTLVYNTKNYFRGGRSAAYYYGNTATSVNGAPPNTERHTHRIHADGRYYINDVLIKDLVGIGADYTVNANNPFGLWSIYDLITGPYSTGRLYSKATIWSFRHYTSAGLTLNFKPVIAGDTWYGGSGNPAPANGFWDVVNEQYHTATQGTLNTVIEP